MPILSGDFFDEGNLKPVAFHAGNGGKVPFEDRVRDYVAAHPDGTLEQCSAALGICYGAVAIACENLVAKGAAAWPSEGD